MIDNLALLVSHGLLMIVAWRLVQRVDLDTENPEPTKRRRRRDA